MYAPHGDGRAGLVGIVMGGCDGEVLLAIIHVLGVVWSTATLRPGSTEGLGCALRSLAVQYLQEICVVRSFTSWVSSEKIVHDPCTCGYVLQT